MSYPCWKIFSTVGLAITLIGLFFLLTKQPGYGR